MVAKTSAAATSPRSTPSEPSSDTTIDVDEEERTFQQNAKIVLAILDTQTGADSPLQHASASLRDDYEVVSTACAYNGCALRYASARLQADPTIVQIAVHQCGYALVFCAPALRRDPQLVYTAVCHTGGALVLAPPALQADRRIVLAAVAQNGCALQYASSALRADPQICHTAVTTTPAAWQYAKVPPTARQSPANQPDAVPMVTRLPGKRPRPKVW